MRVLFTEAEQVPGCTYCCALYWCCAWLRSEVKEKLYRRETSWRHTYLSIWDFVIQRSKTITMATDAENYGAIGAVGGLLVLTVLVLLYDAIFRGNRLKKRNATYMASVAAASKST